MKTLLIANRGEIAQRVIRSAKQLGLTTVAIYSAQDRHAPHVTLAEQSVCIPGKTPVAAYLNIDAIVEYCVQKNIDGVHPGYGFLSENPAFARALSQAGVKLIGPSENAIALMGNKRAAKQLAIQHNVPCIPGENLDSEDNPQKAKKLADIMGYPVLIKAAAGGGGRGMRVCHDADQFVFAYTSARHEAANAFGSPELILEKWIAQGFHVEIQVLFDQYGHGIYLGERDCSLQRRHQKIIEETPSLQINQTMRHAMGEAALRLGKACGYESAGTVEFLVNGEDFYFLEMNTRLQVEHPVTELCTGLDLVAWQLRIAQGEALTIQQTDIKPNGHAIQARVCAEDPYDKFTPQIGTIIKLLLPEERPTLRIDHGITQGLTVSPHYDSLLGKWIAWAPSRDEAINILCRALSETTLLGLKTNISYLQSCLQETDFLAGHAHIQWIDQHPPVSKALEPFHFILSAVVWYLAVDNPSSKGITPLAIRQPWYINLSHGNHTQSIAITTDFFTQQLRAECSHTTSTLTIINLIDQTMIFSIDSVQNTLRWAFCDNTVWIHFQGQTWHCDSARHKPPVSQDENNSGTYRAHLPGRVLSVQVKVGDKILFNQPLLSIESMKMEHTYRSHFAGTVKHIAVTESSQVNKHDVLVQIEHDG